MNVNMINPFIEALSENFQHFRVNWQRGNVSLATSPIKLSGISVDIGVIGEIRGRFFFSCDEPTALYLSNSIMKAFGSGLESVRFNEMERSAFAELGNMIFGHTATQFSKNGIKVDISPPSLIEGEQVYATVFSPQVLKIQVLFKDNLEATLYVAIASNQ